ncbi:hypothetical protein [Rhodococcoides kroppenstedtii]|uniref:hypothetical protein n=1 Tax=Rhodococcoides kroppenstedtii TaxID=293050 RepID=UPI0028E7FD5E|nr:hypothetical protein [Rhodococcus kroppenstedtii]
MFLDANGVVLRQVPDIDAEAITYAAALDAWKSDHDAMASVNKAAEWFQRHAETQAVNNPSSWNSATGMSSMIITGAFFFRRGEVVRQEIGRPWRGVGSRHCGLLAHRNPCQSRHDLSNRIG